MSNVKFAVIGTGHIGKRHAELIISNSESELVAICDILAQEKLGIENYKVPFYNNHQVMLENHSDLDLSLIHI